MSYTDGCTCGAVLTVPRDRRLVARIVGAFWRRHSGPGHGGSGQDEPTDLTPEQLGLSDEQTEVLRKHLASRRQTIPEFLGDVLMEYGLGRATGKDYPPPATSAERR